MFHWPPRRIEAHAMVNFIGLVMENDLEKKLAERSKPLTQEEIRQAMKGLERSIMEAGDKLMTSYARLTDNQLALLEVLEIKPPKNATISGL